MSGKQRRKVLMNRNDMPFLGVYDNVLVQALIVPLHTYLHWGWGFVSEHFVPQVFSRLPRARDGRFELHPLSCIYILTAMSLWSCIGKRRLYVDMSKYEELSKLKNLLDFGVLSQEEFEAKKKNILSGADNTAPKKSIKKTFVTILVALAILVIGGYFYCRSSNVPQTNSNITYKESVEGSTLNIPYDIVLERVKNDPSNKERGIFGDTEKTSIGIFQKKYRGLVFDYVNYYFSSGVVSSIELRKTANQYDGDAVQIIKEAYNSVESSLRRDYSSCQETDEGVVFFNEYEKITILQEEDFSGQCELNVKIEKK